MTKRPGLEVLSNRADFLRAARGHRVSTHAFLLQAWDRGDQGPVRVGFTCSKKVGNAVARNKAKRRLREIARLVLPDEAHRGYDFVLVGRPEKTARHAFGAMVSDLSAGLQQVIK